MESKALEFFKDWSNYLLVTTVASLGWVAKEDPSFCSPWVKTLCIWSFALSAIFAIFTLALIPLVAEQRQLNESIYDVHAQFNLIGIRRRKLKSVCFPQHVFFIMGIALYAVGIGLETCGIGDIFSRATENNSETTMKIEDLLTAGAILAGFTGIFLIFRIQREADYYRNPHSKEPLNQQHFTSSFLLIILATLITMLTGVVAPLLTSLGVQSPLISRTSIVAGLFAGLTLIAGYVVDELVHYRIAFKTWRNNVHNEWHRERPVWIGTLIMAGIVAFTVFALTS